MWSLPIAVISNGLQSTRRCHRDAPSIPQPRLLDDAAAKHSDGVSSHLCTKNPCFDPILPLSDTSSVLQLGFASSNEPKSHFA